MPEPIHALRPGDIVEIQYRLWRAARGESETMVERWISAHVVHAEGGTWPLARLADGQVTEIRPFMTWRAVYRATRTALAA
jgi:hypothetical protein